MHSGRLDVKDPSGFSIADRLLPHLHIMVLVSSWGHELFSIYSKELVHKLMPIWSVPNVCLQSLQFKQTLLCSLVALTVQLAIYIDLFLIVVECS